LDSFNAGTAAEGDAQMRALINTYLSLCACVMTSFAISALGKKYVGIRTVELY
jgi:ammonia channel protein AmtB